MPKALIIFLCIVGTGLLIMTIIELCSNGFSLNKIKQRKVGDGQHGTASFASKRELRQTLLEIPYTPKLWRQGKNLPNQPGLVVSLNQSKHTALVDTGDKHTLVIASPGGGKTTGVLAAQIEYALACGISFVNTDSKGDVVRMYKNIAEKCYGYTCNVIDFRNPKYSNANNNMQITNKYIDLWKETGRQEYKSHAERSAKIVANSVIHSKETFSEGQNAYFYDAAEGAVTAVCLLVAQYCKPEERHIVTVFKILLELMQPIKIPGEKDKDGDGSPSFKSKFHLLLDALPENDKIRWFSGAASYAAGQSFQSVMSTAMSRLLAFIDSDIEQILCHDSKITIEDICEKKVVTFIIFPEEDATKHVLVSLTLSQLLNEAMEYANSSTKENRLERRLYVFADEFGIYPKIANVDGVFGAIRSRNILMTCFIQSEFQLLLRYGNAAYKIVEDCCQNILVSGISPLSDFAESLSKKLGTKTVAGGSVNSRQGTLFSRPNDSKNVTMIARPLMYGDEIRGLKRGKWLIMRAYHNPFIGNIPRYPTWGIELNDPYYPVPSDTNQKVRYGSANSIMQQLGVTFSVSNEQEPHPPQREDFFSATTY